MTVVLDEGGCRDRESETVGTDRVRLLGQRE